MSCTVGKLRRFLNGLPADAIVQIEDLGSDQGLFEDINSLLYTKGIGVQLSYHTPKKEKESKQ